MIDRLVVPPLDRRPDLRLPVVSRLSRGSGDGIGEAARLCSGDGLVSIPIRDAPAIPGVLVGLIAPDRDPPLPAVAAPWDIARTRP